MCDKGFVKFCAAGSCGKTGDIRWIILGKLHVSRRKCGKTYQNAEKPDIGAADLVVVEKILEFFGGKLFSSLHRGLWKDISSIRESEKKSKGFPQLFLISSHEKPFCFTDKIEILEKSTKFSDRFCVKHSFFHTVFHSLWKNWRILHRGSDLHGDFLGKTGAFPQGVKYQLPLISLTISSISVRKTGF